MTNTDSDNLKLVKQHIKSYPDFPKVGIIFRDIFSVLQAPDIFAILKTELVQHAKQITPSIECVVGLESRGFLFGPLISLDLGVPFVPIRKRGKLPGKLKSVTYSLEYGQDVFEVQSDSLQKGTKALIVDDLLATGGTLSAACQLLRECEVDVIECLIIMELAELNGKSKVPATIHSLIQF